MIIDSLMMVVDLIKKISNDTGIRFEARIDNVCHLFASSGYKWFHVNIDHNEETLDLEIIELVMDDGFSSKKIHTNYYYQEYDFIVQKIKENM